MTTTQTFPDPRDSYEGSPLIKETPPWEKDTYGEKNKKTLLPIIENKEEAAPLVPKKEQKAQSKKKTEKRHWGSDTESDSE